MRKRRKEQAYYRIERHRSSTMARERAEKLLTDLPEEPSINKRTLSINEHIRFKR